MGLPCGLNRYGILAIPLQFRNLTSSFAEGFPLTTFLPLTIFQARFLVIAVTKTVMCSEVRPVLWRDQRIVFRID
jgi:hypothetical protein